MKVSLIFIKKTQAYPSYKGQALLFIFLLRATRITTLALIRSLRNPAVGASVNNLIPRSLRRSRTLEPECSARHLRYTSVSAP